MKKIIKYNFIALLFSVTFLSCKKEYGNLNGPSIEDYLKNASKDQLNGLVRGTLSGMRNNEAIYLDAVGVIGREIYRFSDAEPRYYNDLQGSGNTTLNNTGFYITNPWGSRYRTVKNCNVLLDAAANSVLINDEERKGYFGFAKTLKAYELLLNLNLTYTNGIRVDVSNADNLGPVLGYNDAIAAIALLLDEAETDLNGATIAFTLTSGFTNFQDAPGFTKFNRAIAARVAVYRELWADALTNLNASFFDLNGDFNSGAYEEFSNSSGDILNPVFVGYDEQGEVRLAHPSFDEDILPGDDRAGKDTLRSSPITKGGLTSDQDEWVYRSSTQHIPIIRNEELILIYAEAKIQTNDLAGAADAINVIRNGHGLADYTGALTQAALTDEMLYERRYSLFFEGHRWIDMRRYERLNELPVDRAGDDVWTEFPLPSTEQ